MRLPIQFIYTENGIKKDSIAENEQGSVTTNG